MLIKGFTSIEDYLSDSDEPGVYIQQKPHLVVQHMLNHYSYISPDEEALYELLATPMHYLSYYRNIASYEVDLRLIAIGYRYANSEGSIDLPPVDFDHPYFKHIKRRVLLLHSLIQNEDISSDIIDLCTTLTSV